MLTVFTSIPMIVLLGLAGWFGVRRMGHGPTDWWAWTLLISGGVGALMGVTRMITHEGKAIESRRVAIESRETDLDVCLVFVGRQIAERREGSRVLLLTNDPTLVDRITETLTDGLDDGDASVKVRVLKPTPTPQQWADQFVAAVNAHPDCDTVVSTFDLPRGVDPLAHLSTVQSGRARMIVLNGDPHRLRKAVANGAVSLVVRRPIAVEDEDANGDNELTEDDDFYRLFGWIDRERPKLQ